LVRELVRLVAGQHLLFPAQVEAILLLLLGGRSRRVLLVVVHGLVVNGGVVRSCG